MFTKLINQLIIYLIFLESVFLKLIFTMHLAKTFNLQIGCKLSGKPKDEIMKEIFSGINLYDVVAVQFGYDIVSFLCNK